MSIAYASTDVGRLLNGFPVGETAPDSLVATVLRADKSPAAGVIVQWSADSGGVVAPATSTTDASGKTWTRWTPGTKPSYQTVFARADSVSAKASFLTVADAPVRLTLSPDTLRFTKVKQTLSLKVIGTDRFGNSVFNAKVYWHSDHSDRTIPPNYTATSVVSFSATGVPARGWVYAELYYHPRDWDSVVTVFDPIIARTSLTARASSALTVGDTGTIAFAAAFDPDGTRIPEDWRLATFSSSAPGVATVDSTGAVHALAPGTTTISATIAGQASQTTLYVYPLAGLGDPRDVGDSGGGTVLFGPSEANAFAADGSRYQAIEVTDGPGFGLYANGYFPSGAGRFSRRHVHDTDYNVAVPSDQTAYFRLGYTLDVLSADGALLSHATPPCAGRMAVAASGQAYLGAGACVSAVNADGTTAWTAAVAGSTALLGSTTRLFALGQQQLSALSYSGQILWRRTDGFSARSVTAVANTGEVLIGDPDASRVISVDQAGSTRWTAPLPAGTTQLIVDGSNHVIALGANDVRAIDLSNGSVLWTYHLPEIGQNVGIVAGNDGRIYFRRELWIVVLDGATGGLIGRSRRFTNDPEGGLALQPGHLFVIGVPRVYAFDVPFGPAAAWSQLGATYRRTFVLPP